MIQNEKIERLLKCHLTPEEIAAQAKLSARTIAEIARLEDESKETASSYKARIQEKKNVITEASKKVENEYEYRNVECERQFDRETQTVSVVRLDTGAVEESRPFTASEKQLTLEEAEDALEAEQPEEEIFAVDAFIEEEPVEGDVSE